MYLLFINAEMHSRVHYLPGEHNFDAHTHTHTHTHTRTHAHTHTHFCLAKYVVDQRVVRDKKIRSTKQDL